MEGVFYIKKAIIGNKSIHKGKAVVCYLDLLGFSNTIRREWNNKDKNPLDLLLSLKEQITSLENQKRLILKEHGSGEEKRVYYYNTKFISDSIIITLPIGDDMTIGDVWFAIQGMFNSIANCWGMCLEVGYTIRGGIDYGDVYWNEKDIIGPAYMDAYVLESDVAKVSRVVCGDKFIELVNDINMKMGSQNTAILRNLVYDVDGLLCVNPNIMYDDKEIEVFLTNQVLELMKGKSAYIKHKYLSLHKMLVNKDELHVPTIEEAKNYSIKIKE